MHRLCAVQHLYATFVHLERERERVVEAMKRLFYCDVKSIASPKRIEERKKERFEEKGEGWIFSFFFFKIKTRNTMIAGSSYLTSPVESW